MAVGTVAMLYRWAGYCSVILPTAVPHTGSLGHRLLYGTNSPDSNHSTPLADTVHTIFIYHWSITKDGRRGQRVAVQKMKQEVSQ